ncbi:hypothetical protein BJ742DRAFT_772177 [Cladochytrium replicatum]|nr:hypothetical protein BJ742DRAFT_772177 [Cladochytrium replicatum]
MICPLSPDLVTLKWVVLHILPILHDVREHDTIKHLCLNALKIDTAVSVPVGVFKILVKCFPSEVDVKSVPYGGVTKERLGFVPVSGVYGGNPSFALIALTGTGPPFRCSPPITITTSIENVLLSAFRLQHIPPAPLPLPNSRTTPTPPETQRDPEARVFGRKHGDEVGAGFLEALHGSRKHHGAEDEEDHDLERDEGNLVV